MRLAEMALFLAPFLVFVLWWQLGARSRLMAWAILGGVLTLLATLAWLALTTGLPRAGGYVPARLQDGRIIPGHGT